MIYEYEACVLKHINKAVPAIKMATYAKEPDMFGALAQVKEVPSLLYFRDVMDWNFPYTYTFLDIAERKYASFNKFSQNYVGRIYVVSNKDAFSIASKIRFYWNENSYIDVPWNKEFIRVALRLLYIKVDQDRSVKDPKGPNYFVEFGWSSQLFMDNIDKDQVDAIVDEINIYLDNGAVKVMSDSNLITVVK